MKLLQIRSLADMLPFYAEKYVALARLLEGFKGIFIYGNEEKEKDQFDRSVLQKMLRDSAKILAEIGLVGSVKLALRIADECEQEWRGRGHYPKRIEALTERIDDELEETCFLHLTEAESALYRAKEPLFGPVVADKFPSAAFDIDESGKCIALGRYTAAVYHLMRVMEISLAALNRCLGIPDPVNGNDRSWGNILKNVRQNLIARKNFAENDKFKEFHARLDSVKDAWRNGTMHVEKTYTQEEAQNIFAMVKGFMQAISDRMDQAGQPPA